MKSKSTSSGDYFVFRLPRHSFIVPLNLATLLIIPAAISGFLWDEKAEVFTWPKERDRGRGEQTEMTFVPLSENVTLLQTVTSQFATFRKMGMGNLEVGIIDVEQSIEEKSVRKHWKVYFGTTVTKVKAPVTFRFHVKLNDQWNFYDNGESIEVICPEILPSDPPAIHMDQLQKFSDRGWARWSASAQLRETESGFLPIMRERAQTFAASRELQEQARAVVTEFVESIYAKGKPVKVRFVNEIDSNLNPILP